MTESKSEKLDRTARYSGSRIALPRREPMLVRVPSPADRSLTRGLTARELIDMAREARIRATTP